MKRLGIIFASGLIVIMYVLGYFANAIIIKNREIVSAEFYIVFGIALIAFVIIFYFLELLYKKLDENCYHTIEDQDSGIKGSKVKEGVIVYKGHIVKYALIIFMCWIPYFVLRFPGHVDVDTYWELLEVYGLDALKDHHPFFDTLIFGLFWEIGDTIGSNIWSVFIYAVVQSLFTSIAFAASIVYMIHHGVPDILKRISLGFVCFFPAIPMMAQSMSKDSLHAWIYVIFYLGFVELIRSEGRILKDIYFDVIGVIVILLLMLTKKTGIYVVSISLAMSLLCIRNRMRLVVATMIAVFFYICVWCGGILQMLEVEPGPSREMMSVPSQQVSAILRYYGENIAEEEYAILSGVYYDAKNLGSYYEPTRADSTKARWREDSDSAKKKNFFRWYFKQWAIRPKIMLLAIAANSYGVFSVDIDSIGNESFIFLQDNMVSVGNGDGLENNLAAWSSYDVPSSIVHEVISTSYRPIWAKEIVDSFGDVYLGVARILPVMFSKVLYATWIPLVVLGYSIYKKSIKHFMICVPVGGLTGMLIVGPIVLPRYMATSLFVIPLFLAVPWILGTRTNRKNSGRD